MKMTKEHIEIIHNAFVSFSEDKYKMSLLSTDIHCGQYTDTLLAWNVFKHCKIEGNTITWICDNLYSYLNDNHINSVVLKEFKSLKEKI